MESPRIYVASLSDYNNGRLEGKWFDFSDYSDASELMDAIQEMLDEITEKYNDGEVREEWAVHDYEYIPSTLASEYMGESDFQQIYDVMEVADERGIPMEVLMERVGDTGNDDYQSVADSLMFVVSGNDESDIVHEYESQIGEFDFDFWQNHIYIDSVTERVMYSEDVDRFREDIQYENPDMDEDEVERLAEEQADEEESRRNDDLVGYLEEMGYTDIPSWVSKDYESAWENALSYDFDVIHHDGEMYVFSSNYGIGGVVIGGLVGAYIGYKVAENKKAKSQIRKAKGKVQRLGKKIKSKFDKGGEVKISDEDLAKIRQVMQEEQSKKKGFFGKIKESSPLTQENQISQKEAFQFIKENPQLLMLLEKGGSVDYKEQQINDLNNWDNDEIANFLGVSISQVAKDRQRYIREAQSVMMLNSYSEGGGVDSKRKQLEHRLWNERGYDYKYLNSLSLKELNSLYDTEFYYDVEDDQFSEGGGVDEYINIDKMNPKQYEIVTNFNTLKSLAKNGFIELHENTGLRYKNYEDKAKSQVKGYVTNVRHDYIKSAKQPKFKFNNRDYAIGYIKGLNFLKLYVLKDISENKYAEGGGIGFKGLANKVAKRYEGKSVAPKYQGEYGKRYSKSEAQEVGNKVAGKVYWQQQGRKFTDGGGVGNKKYYGLLVAHHQPDNKYRNVKPQTIITNSKEEMVEKLNKIYEQTFLLKDIPYSLEDLQDKYAINGTYISDDWAFVTTNYDEFVKTKKIALEDFQSKYDNGGGVGEDVSWDVTFYDKDNGETFDVNVLGWFENEEDAIKQAISENNVYVDEDDYGRMYWGQNEVTIYGAKKNYNVGGGVDYGKGGKTPIQYKGYTINFIQGEYRADAYANPQITDKNLAKLKQKINQYLKGNSKYDNGGNITDYDWANEFRKTKKYFVVLLAEENGEEEIFEGNVQARSESEALSEARRGFEFNYPNKMIKKVSIDKTKNTNRYSEGGGVNGVVPNDSIIANYYGYKTYNLKKYEMDTLRDAYIRDVLEPHKSKKKLDKINQEIEQKVKLSDEYDTLLKQYGSADIISEMADLSERDGRSDAEMKKEWIDYRWKVYPYKYADGGNVSGLNDLIYG